MYPNYQWLDKFGCVWCEPVLGALVGKTAQHIPASVCLYVCLSESNNSRATEWIFVKIYAEEFFLGWGHYFTRQLWQVTSLRLAWFMKLCGQWTACCNIDVSGRRRENFPAPALNVGVESLVQSSAHYTETRGPPQRRIWVAANTVLPAVIPTLKAESDANCPVK